MHAWPCWALTDSQFAFPRAVLYILRSVCSLPILSCSCFLPVLAGYLQRLTFAGDTGWRYMWASRWASLGVISRLISQELMESAKWFTASASFCYYGSKSWLLLYPSFTVSPSCSSWLSIVSFWRARGKRAPLAVSCAAGEDGCSLTGSHVPPRVESSPERVPSIHMSCALWGMPGVVKWVKWNCISYPLQCVQSQIFFSSNTMLVLLPLDFVESPVENTKPLLCSLGERW